MNLEIILSSFSLGDASEKIFGYCNGKKKELILNFLLANGYDENVFSDKNKNMKYPRVSKICPVCGDGFKTEKGSDREKETCSISCSNSFKPKRNKLPDDVLKKRKCDRLKDRKNLLVDFTCSICGQGFQRRSYKKVKTCSAECLSKLLSDKANERVSNGTHIGWKTRPIISYPEKFFKKVLDDNKIFYLGPNYPLPKNKIGLNESSCFFLDFYIEKDGRMIDLEIDGKQHNFPERKDSDNKRDFLLTSAGYEVYRIAWKGVNSKKTKEYMAEQIKLLLEFLNR